MRKLVVRAWWQDGKIGLRVRLGNETEEQVLRPKRARRLMQKLRRMAKTKRLELRERPRFVPKYVGGDAALFNGDCTLVMQQLAANSVDTVISDPPYHLTSGKNSKKGFLGKNWDGGDVAFRPETWKEALRVTKPGGYLLAFSGSRTYHRMACAIEDAGWVIKDCIFGYLYGCLSADTEIMVDGRWENYHNLSTGQQALCYDLATDSYLWQPIQELFIYPNYSDTTYRISSERTDQIVSRQHRCVVEGTSRGKLRFQTAETLGLKVRVPVVENFSGLIQELGIIPSAETTSLRASSYISTTSADVTCSNYDGLVWCIRVATGAFVARRLGKVFITGNSGFPKSKNISKDIDRLKGKKPVVVGTEETSFGYKEDRTRTHTTRELTRARSKEAKRWTGYGSAMKPSLEPVCICQKPMDGTYAENALRHGVAGLNIDGARIKGEPVQSGGGKLWNYYSSGTPGSDATSTNTKGRWPANTFFQHVCSPVMKLRKDITPLVRKMLKEAYRGYAGVSGMRKEVQGSSEPCSHGEDLLQQQMSRRRRKGDVDKNQKDYCLSSVPGNFYDSEGVGKKWQKEILQQKVSGTISEISSRTPFPSFRETPHRKIQAENVKDENESSTTYTRSASKLERGCNSRPLRVRIGQDRYLAKEEASYSQKDVSGSDLHQRTSFSDGDESGKAARKNRNSTSYKRKKGGQSQGESYDYGRNAPLQISSRDRKNNREVGDKTGAVARKVQKTEAPPNKKLYVALCDIQEDWIKYFIPTRYYVGCECTGTKRVRSSNTAADYTPTGKQGLVPVTKNVKHGQGHGDSEGFETVKEWRCHPSCVVAALDRQGDVSGVHDSGAAQPGSGTFRQKKKGRSLGRIGTGEEQGARYGDGGSTSRFFQTFEPEVPFFYTAKPGKQERTVGGRVDNVHSTLKPLSIMKYLCQLTRTPTGGVVLDPFMGSGTTGVAALMTGRRFIGIELERKSFTTSVERMENLPYYQRVEEREKRERRKQRERKLRWTRLKRLF